MGYVAYRVPRDEVRIAQLVVDPESRGRGIARLLVDELKHTHASRRGIGLRCRRDWDASTAWPKLGFTSLGERPGRSAAGSLLTEWWLDFGHPDLMSWAPGETETAAIIDANVFLDLHGCVGPDAELTKQMLESLSDRLDLVVSAELLIELNRGEDPTERQRLIQLASARYPQVRADPAKVDEWSAQLMESTNPSGDLSPQDRSDIRHVAWAAAAGVPIVLTRDDRASKRLEGVARAKADVIVCHPSTLPAVLHERESTGAYAPAALAGTQYEVQEITDNLALAADFLDTGASERRQHFDRRIRQLAAQRPTSSLRLIRDAVGTPRALLGTTSGSSGLQVTIARLKKGLLEATLAAHLVDMVRRTAAESRQALMQISDPHCSDRLRKAFRTDGFVDTDAGILGLGLDARVSRHEVADLVHAHLPTEIRDATADLKIAQQATPAAVLEHALRPLRVLDADLPTWLVPIRQQWASDLFGYPDMLTTRDNDLGLGIEHVFYKRQKAGEHAPGRVLWYMNSPGSEVFGCSLLTRVDDAPAQDLFRRYRRLGVYKFADVQACERRDGKARALNVADTELFPRPISLRRLRELAAGHDHPLQLQGASRVSPQLFSSIIEEAHSR